MDFKVGDVLLFRGSNMYSKAIMLANMIHYRKKGWTHAAIVADVQGQDIILYEALSNGFIVSPWSKKGLNDRIFAGTAIRGRTKLQLYDVMNKANRYLGLSYAWTDIFQIALFTIFGKKTFIFNTQSKKLICSEAVARILYDSSNKQINFESEFKKKYDLITPQDLRESKQIKWK